MRIFCAPFSILAFTEYSLSIICCNFFLILYRSCPLSSVCWLNSVFHLHLLSILGRCYVYPWHKLIVISLLASIFSLFWGSISWLQICGQSEMHSLELNLFDMIFKDILSNTLLYIKFVDSYFMCNLYTQKMKYYS